MPLSVFELLNAMNDEKIIVAYNGAIDEALLESVYSMMDRHLEEQKVAGDKRKKVFHILVESLQNVFHHNSSADITDLSRTGFIIKYKNDQYSIITGNNVLSTSIAVLTEKIEKINSLSPADLKVHYQQSLARSELSAKGGAGLGIIEMARKSGNKLKYEFTKVNNEYSFFTLEVTI